MSSFGTALASVNPGICRVSCVAIVDIDDGSEASVKVARGWSRWRRTTRKRMMKVMQRVAMAAKPGKEQSRDTCKESLVGS